MNKPAIKIIILAAIIVFGIWLTHFSPWKDNYTSEAIQETVKQYGILSPLAFIIVFVIGTIISIPASVLTLVAAVLFQMTGFLYVMIGIAITAAICYFVGHYLGHNFVHKHLDGKYHKFCAKIKKHTFKGIFVLRLLPVPFPTLSYIAGALKLPFKEYYTASVLGVMPPIFLYAWLFTNLGEAILNKNITTALLLNKNIIIPFTLLAILTFIVLWKSKNNLNNKKKK